MLVLLGLILRAVSLEFRSKVASTAWRRAWDVGFAAGSALPALLFGVAMGNILRGLPLGADRNFAGTFFGLLNPYALLIGVLGLTMFATHGAAYIVLKTDGELAERARGWVRRSWFVYLVLFLVAAGSGIFHIHALSSRLQDVAAPLGHQAAPYEGHGGQGVEPG